MTPVPAQRGARRGTRILLVDPDDALARFVTSDLRAEGFTVEVLTDGRQALSAAERDCPDLLLLEVDLPGAGGIEVVRRLRAHPSTASVPVLLLSRHGAACDRVAGLTAGADDYLVKPVDMLELVARVTGVLRRTDDHRALSPLTGLPGNGRIDVEIAARAASGSSYAVCHVDLDEFKAFNDAYGFQRGDGLLLLLADCLRDAAGRVATPDPFVGHVGGDDFIVVCTAEQAEPLCADVLAAFDAQVGGHYDPRDSERGWLEVIDRRGELRRHPLVGVSIGVASHDGGARDHRAVIAAASEMKGVAKTVPGSLVAVDRRG